MFFFDEQYNHFEMFGTSHLFALLFFIALFVLLMIFKGKINPKTDRWIRRSVALFMVLMEWIFYAWALFTGGFQTSLLPLGLCAISMYATAIALWTKHEKLFQIIFPWAMTGALLSLIVADLSHDFPHFRYFHFFGNHGLFLMGNLYLLLVSRFHFSYKHLLKSTGILMIYTIIMYPLNFLLDANHLFLREVPAEVAPLYSFLGDFWLIGFIFSIFLLFHLIYLPVHLYNRHKRTSI
jgi:hypothetical integral membrane protein (TIGR02206 family)